MQFLSSLWQNWTSFFDMGANSAFAQQHPFAHSFVFWSFVVCFLYMLVIALFFTFVTIAAIIENAFRDRESRAEDYSTLAVSRFTTPVSVIVPAYNENVGILNSVGSLLKMEYPEFEVIVVNDGSTDDTIDILKREYQLEACEIFYRKTLECQPIRAIYRSPKEPRLIVVDKENGGKADGLNCGINLSKYPYLMSVDGDTVYTRDTLLKGMRLAVRDPESVVAVASTIGISLNPEKMQTPDGFLHIDHQWLIAFQHLDYLRSFVTSRLGWSKGNFMLCAPGACTLWRRNVVMELNGFARHFTCEDIEITFRAYEKFLREKRKIKVLALPDTVALTEGPDTVAKLVSQRERWQRVIMETVWHHRRMMLNPRYGAVGLLGMPYYLLAEFIAPVFQGLAVASLAVAVWYGVLDFALFGAFLGTVAFCNGIYTMVALWLQDVSFRPYRTRDLLYLALIAPLELIVYRPILFYAQWKGMIGFFRGDKSWQRFERNNRGGGSPIAEEPEAQRVTPEAISTGARITSNQ